MSVCARKGKAHGKTPRVSSVQESARARSCAAQAQRPVQVNRQPRSVQLSYAAGSYTARYGGLTTNIRGSSEGGRTKPRKRLAAVRDPATVLVLLRRYMIPHVTLQTGTLDDARTQFQPQMRPGFLAVSARSRPATLHFRHVALVSIVGQAVAKGRWEG